MMRVFGKRRLVPLGLLLLLCVVMTGCAQNPQAARQTDQTNDKPGFLSRILGSNRPITVPEGTDLTVVLDASDRSRGRATQPASNPRLVSLNAVQFDCTAGKTNDRTEGSTAAEADSESGSSLPTDFAKQTISGQRDGL